ncbi:MAG: hypothetical protein AAB511_01750 [Patescibacteria group bacterium]
MPDRHLRRGIKVHALLTQDLDPEVAFPVPLNLGLAVGDLPAVPDSGEAIEAEAISTTPVAERELTPLDL